MKMKTVILLFLVVTPSFGFACSCSQSSDEEAFEKSQLVILVKITETKLVLGDQLGDLVQAKFEVTEKFKGDVIRLNLLQSTATSTCSTALVAGHQYLIYSNNDTIKNINACNKSRWINTTREKGLLDVYRNFQ